MNVPQSIVSMVFTTNVSTTCLSLEKCFSSINRQTTAQHQSVEIIHPCKITRRCCWQKFLRNTYIL